MLTILHTADWHIGQTLFGHDRASEHRHVFASMARLVVERAVDVVIVAGDIYDTLNPSADAQALFYETIGALRRARPGLRVIVIAGNHDSAPRLEAPDTLFRALDLTVVGTLARCADGINLDRHLLPLATADGALVAHVLAIPYPRYADLPPIPPDQDGSPIVAGVTRLYGAAIDAARARIGAAPLIVTGHLHLTGAQESEGAERRILMGGEHAVPASIFPADLAYVALGHLHRPQAVTRATIRYAGSLFPLSRTEIGYDHGVTLLRIGDGATRVEHVALPRPVPHVRVPASGTITISDLPTALAALDLPTGQNDTDRPFLHLSLAPQGSAAGLRAEVEALVDAIPVRLASLQIARAEPAETLEPTFVPLRLADQAPLDLFRAAFRQANGNEPSTTHETLFRLAAEDG
jgi:DNA repair protein SbcD/Mre11